MAFPGFVVNREIPGYTASLRRDHFTAEKERKGPVEAVRCGIDSVWDFPPLSSPHTKLSVWKPLLMSQGITLRSRFRVIFPCLALVLSYQKAEVKTSPLSGIWLPRMSHFYNVPASPVRMFLFYSLSVSLRVVCWKTLPSYYSIHFHIASLNVIQTVVSFVLLIHTSRGRYLLVALMQQPENYYMPDLLLLWLDSLVLNSVGRHQVSFFIFQPCPCYNS